MPFDFGSIFMQPVISLALHMKRVYQIINQIEMDVLLPHLIDGITMHGIFRFGLLTLDFCHFGRKKSLTINAFMAYHFFLSCQRK